MKRSEVTPYNRKPTHRLLRLGTRCSEGKGAESGTNKQSDKNNEMNNALEVNRTKNNRKSSLRKNRPTSTKHRVLHDSRNRKSNHLTKSDMKEESSVESASTTADRRNIQNGLSDTNSPSTNSFPAPQQLLTSSVQHVERKPHRAAVSPSPTQLHRKLRHTHPNPHLLPTRHKPFMNLVHSTRTNTHHPDTDKYLSLNNLNETTESLLQ
ncbi:hypothetical protein BLNAU_24512 [Blattamonas nauphoetae]|uniref:Uncharacterized protein n=1 Tax=Blattamonas nauphoetae TaxID=2049346 RepID=A0ABQ9WMI7_9EUKA|nr:hypothetical protein BLNAU_24512 [Blattamonas nauphoetae]